MLIARLSSRLWLAFPEDGRERQYVFDESTRKMTHEEAEPLIEATVNDRRLEYLEEENVTQSLQVSD